MMLSGSGKLSACEKRNADEFPVEKEQGYKYGYWERERTD